MRGWRWGVPRGGCHVSRVLAPGQPRAGEGEPPTRAKQEVFLSMNFPLSPNSILQKGQGSVCPLGQTAEPSPVRTQAPPAPCGGRAFLWVRPPRRGLCSQSRGKAGETRAPRGPACGLADLRDRVLRLCAGRGDTLLARRGASRPEERRELLVEDEPLLE